MSLLFSSLLLLLHKYDMTCTLITIMFHYFCMLLCTYVHLFTYTYTILHYLTLHYTTLHYTTSHYTTLHYTTSHYTTLHYTTSHYTTLHYPPLSYPTLVCRHLGTCAAVYYMLLALSLQRLALRRLKYQLREVSLLGGLVSLHVIDQ
jgi:hypothetical protein